VCSLFGSGHSRVSRPASHSTATRLNLVTVGRSRWPCGLEPPEPDLARVYVVLRGCNLCAGCFPSTTACLDRILNTSKKEEATTQNRVSCWKNCGTEKRHVDWWLDCLKMMYQSVAFTALKVFKIIWFSWKWEMAALQISTWDIDSNSKPNLKLAYPNIAVCSVSSSWVKNPNWLQKQWNSTWRCY
jgi:hypothetical protein